MRERMMIKEKTTIDSTAIRKNSFGSFEPLDRYWLIICERRRKEADWQEGREGVAEKRQRNRERAHESGGFGRIKKERKDKKKKKEKKSGIENKN